MAADMIRRIGRREPVLVLAAVAVAAQGILETAQDAGVTSWAQLVTVLIAVATRMLVTPLADPRLDR